MSVMQKIKSIARNPPHGTAPHGWLRGFVVDKGERYGAALGFGFLKGYYAEKFIWKGQPGELWIGAGATVFSALLQAFGRGASRLAPHLERVGDAGMQGWLNSMGANWGMKKAGRQVAFLPGSAGAKKRAIAGETVGEIPAAMGGAYLTDEEMARFRGAR